MKVFNKIFKLRKLSWFVVTSLVLISTNSNSFGAISLKENQLENINRQTQYFVDESNKLSILDVLKGDQVWQRTPFDSITLPLHETTAWIKFSLKNDSTIPKTAVLEFNPIFLEKITLFNHAGEVLEISGSTIEPKKIEASPTISITVPNGDHDYFLSIQSRGNTFAITLRSPELQAQKDIFDLIMVSALVGGIMSLVFYHIFMYLTYRNRNHLLCSAFIASVAFFTISFTSYHRQLLPSTIGGFHTDFWWSALASQVTSVLMYLFSADLMGFYPTKNNPRRKLALWLTILPILHLSCIALIFLSNRGDLLMPVRLCTALDFCLLPTLAIGIWWRDRTNKIALYYAISWVPFVLGAVAIILWLSGAIPHHNVLPWSVPVGAVAQSLLLSFASSQRLKKRDAVISSFVSKDIVSELDRGEDPLKFSPKNVERCIIFMDMHGYTSFSQTNPTLECHRVLNQYFEAINSTVYATHGQIGKIIGDAVMIVYKDPKHCLEGVVQLRKVIAQINHDRVNANVLPIKFGAGVSFGTMLEANFGSNQKLDRTLVGDTVNVASRLETITRTFSVDVLCSEEFVLQHPKNEFFRPAGYVLLKGRQKKSLVYEFFAHAPAEVIDWKKSTVPHLLKVIELELNGQYEKALQNILMLIETCPDHSLKPGLIMDPTLLAVVTAIEEKTKQLGIPIPAITSTRFDLSKTRRAS